MKCNRKILVILFLISLFFSLETDTAKSQEFGVVLVSHGSIHDIWNNRILALEKKFQPISDELQASSNQFPVNRLFSHRGKVAFLRFDDVNTLPNAIDTFQANGISKILLVHLSPFSCTVRHEEIKHIAGKVPDDEKKSWLVKKAVSLSDLPAWPDDLKIEVAPAMDDHPLIIDILKKRARELSKNPATESLILLGYGPIDELENITWLRLLERIGKRLGTLGFKEVVGVSLRHHSADLIRAQAITELQKTAKSLSENGRVIVLPYALYISPDDPFQKELQSCLRGIVDRESDIGKKGIISDDEEYFDKWLEEVISKGMNQPEVMPVNRTWSAMDKARDVDIGINQYGLVED
jgi:hypothetical protein